MARFSALLDACVLVPVTLTDTLLRTAEDGLYRPVWSARILQEVVVALESVHPKMAHSDAAKKRVMAMNSAFEDASSEPWEALVDSIVLPDPDDRHVVAAALAGRADVLVTHNVKDFPREVLARFDLDVQTPDHFLLNLLDLDPDRVLATLRRQAQATRRPQINAHEVINNLERAGVPEFAAKVRDMFSADPSGQV